MKLYPRGCVLLLSLLGFLASCGSQSVPTTAPPAAGDTQAPTVPAGLAAIAVSETQINLAWSAASDNYGVTGYLIERCTGTACVNFKQIDMAVATSLSDTGLSSGMSYSYRIRASDAAGNLSGYSSSVSATTLSSTDVTPPSAPATLTSTAVSSVQISLSWADSTDNQGVTGYLVERCEGAACSNFVQIAAPAGDTFIDSGLNAATSYSYRVRATDAAGNLSPYSPTATSVTPASGDVTPPTAPASLTAVAGSSSQITVSWSASLDAAGVTGYLVERCTGANCNNFVQFAVTTATFVIDSGLTASANYSYRVRATDAAGNLSAYSTVASARTGAAADTSPPTAPAALVATPSSSTQINLSWSASSDNVGVTGYLIERCAGAACSNFLQIATSATPAFADTSLFANTHYSYRVRATDAAGNLSAYSATVSALTATAPDSTPPSAPSGLTATAASATEIDLAWTASTDNVGVTGYLIERCQGAGCTSFAQIGTSATTSFSSAGLTASTAFSFRVRATDAAGNVSAYSQSASANTSAPADTTPPSAPSNLTATAVSSTQINLTWTASTDNVGVTGYLIERCLGAACTGFAQVGASMSPAFSSSTLSASSTYRYRVRATDAADNLSAYSAIASASTQAPPDTTAPSAPANLTATDAGTAQINLAWTASTDNVGVTGYRIERCAGAGCTNFVQVATSTATAYSNAGLAAGTAYSYRVRANDAAGNLSAYSATASATTQSAADTTPPTAPTNLQATAASSTQLNLTWTASTDNVGVAAYRIERCQGGGCTAFAQVATSVAPAFNNSGLTVSTSYSYRVRAADAAGNVSAYSAVASAATPNNSISVSVTPVRGGLTVSQSVSLSAAVANDVGGAGVTWSASQGSFGATTTTGATYVAPGSAGKVTITATSVADNSKSATASLGITDLSLVGTYHNDNSRDGANTHEYALTTANVNTASFGKLFSCSVDGAVYAQPLWVANVTVGGKQRNVVVVATQHDSLYAFDADASPCVTLWHASLLDAAHGAGAGETSVPSGTTNGLVGNGYGDVKPEIGVTGTPVIDAASQTIYAVAKSAQGNALPIYQRMHAISLLDGSERSGGPANITSAITVAGTGDGSSNSRVAFNTQTEFQRPGLALVNGIVYAAWSSHEDKDPYHGWVIGFNAASVALAPNAVFNTTPNKVGSATYSRGGIWMSGGAPAVDANNNLYLSTGNGTFDASSGGSNYGDSTIKLSTGAGLAFADYFTPADQASLNTSDSDHGSGGAALLVNAGGGNYIVAAGKEGTIFVLQQSSLGGYGSSGNTNAHQNFATGFGVYSTAAFWNNALYVAGAGGGVHSYAFDTASGLFNSGATSISSHSFAWPGASPSISAQGATNGIAWALDSHPYCTNQSSGCGPTVLYAFDATHLSTQLWTSALVAGDAAGNAVKFTVPTIANGKVYVGTRGADTGAGTAAVLGELDVYGLKPN